MNRTTIHLLRSLFLIAAATTALAGCGGGSTPDAAPVAGQAVVEPRSAQPDDNGARTRQGLYLTAAQARELAQRLADRVVTVEARCCGYEQAELDVLIAFGVQAAADLPPDAPFIVSGPDLRQAAAVSNRLGELGARRVYLITH